VRAIILAGGKGERLMPFTSDKPKCLVEVAGKPLIARQLTWLASQGIEDVAISCGYRWRAIEEFIEDGSAFGLRVTYAVEEHPLGRGGGLRNALSGMPSRSELVVACNGDVLTHLPLAPMVRRHQRSRALATLLLVPFVSTHGVVEVDHRDRITGFREKPVLPYWLSGGVYILAPEIRTKLPRQGDHETSTWPRLAAKGQLAGYRYRGFWQPLDSAKDIKLAEAALRRRRLAP
jgi:NDP-sugar pyrophosphorylase family protein